MISPPRTGETVTIGCQGNCIIDVIAGDLACVAADTVIAGICVPTAEMHPRSTALDGLDQALQGAIGRLQVDGIFSGNWGETLLLSAPPPPIRAGTVLMLGLGPLEGGLTKRLRRAIRIGTSQAARLGAEHVAFAPARLETGRPRFNAPASARAVISGLFDVLSARPDQLGRWSFIAPPPDFPAVVNHFRVAFEAVVEH